MYRFVTNDVMEAVIFLNWCLFAGLSLMYTDKFATKHGEVRWSVELKPPGLGKTVDDLIAQVKLAELMAHNPIGVDVTYHQEKLAYTKADHNGLQVAYPVSKNPGTIAVCSYLAGKYKEKCSVEIIPHLICGGFSVKECEEALIDCHTAGLHTVLILQGDSPDKGKLFQPHPQGHKHAAGFVEQVINMNNGRYLYPIESPVKTNFCVAVAAYPEKHPAAPNRRRDLLFLKQKVDNGVQYIVTQMFFDNSSYFSFVSKARAVGITVPIIPGLKILDKKIQLYSLPNIFHFDYPDDFEEEVHHCKDDAAVYQLGLEWCVQQCKELLAWTDPLGKPVPALHFYSMNRGDQILDVLKRLV